jgi:hypothetical protein
VPDCGWITGGKPVGHFVCLRVLNGGLRGKCLEVLNGYTIVVGAQVGKPEEHSICLRVLDGGLCGSCLDGV